MGGEEGEDGQTDMTDNTSVTLVTRATYLISKEKIAVYICSWDCHNHFDF